MRLEDILNDSKLNEMLNKYMYENYSKCNLYGYIELDDYKQEIYIYLMEHLGEYDSSKSCISTFLYMCINTKSRNMIRHFKGKRRQKYFNGLSLNGEFKNKFGRPTEVLEMVEDEMVNIEKEVVANETAKDILSKFQNDEIRNIVILLMEGYNKREICKILKFGYTKMFNKLGNINKENTIKYIVNKYYQEKEEA